MRQLTAQEAYLALRKNRARRDFAKFSALIETPGNLATGVVLPGSAKLVVSTSAVLGAITGLVDAGSRGMSGAIGAANAKHSIGYIAGGVTMAKTSGAPGTVSLYVTDGFRTSLIAQG